MTESPASINYTVVSLFYYESLNLKYSDEGGDRRIIG